MNLILGEQARDEYLTGVEVARRLEKLGSTGPVREGVQVVRLAARTDGYVLRTDDGEIAARTVVVATGHENVPRIPALAAALPDRVAQYHTADYRATAFPGMPRRWPTQ